MTIDYCTSDCSQDPSFAARLHTRFAQDSGLCCGEYQRPNRQGQIHQFYLHLSQDYKPNNSSRDSFGSKKSLVMKKFIFLLYGIVAYLIFFGTFCYAVGFVSTLVVPKHIDSEPTSPLGYAFLVNAGLLS